MEKYLKLVLDNKDGIFCILFLLILFSSKVDTVLKKICSKENAIWVFGSNNTKSNPYIINKNCNILYGNYYNKYLATEICKFVLRFYESQSLNF